MDISLLISGDQCSSARRDLCGGRPVTVVSTATDPEGNRSRRRQSGEASRSRGGQRRRADSFYLGDSAAVGSADAEFGRALAGSLPARHVNGRFPRGVDRPLGEGCAESFAGGDFSADGRIAGRVRALAQAGSLGASICVCVGRRRFPSGAHGRPWRMHACADRCDAGGQFFRTGREMNQRLNRPES
jgi:hypothetical protein